MTDLEKTNLLFFASEAEQGEDNTKENVGGLLSAELSRKLAVEVVGTYALALVAAASGSPIYVGFALAALVCAFGHISGGHFNPAVSLAVYLRGKSDLKTFFTYALAQIAGAFIGAAQHNYALTDQGLTFAANGGFPELGTFTTASGQPIASGKASAGSAFLAELTATMIFTTVILNVATTRAQAKNSFFGIAIGFVLTALASSIGNVSGGCLNPALGIALPALAEKTDDIWIYIVAPLLGGALGAGFFRFTADPDEFKEKGE